MVPAMKKLIIAVALLISACGPTWNDVVRHPDGTIEDPKTGECWRDSPSGAVPVVCPPDAR